MNQLEFQTWLEVAYRNARTQDEKQAVDILKREAIRARAAEAKAVEFLRSIVDEDRYHENPDAKDQAILWAIEKDATTLLHEIQDEAKRQALQAAGVKVGEPIRWEPLPANDEEAA